VNTDDNLFHILSTLASSRILSAPVYDRTTNSYIGFVDVIDITTVALVAMKCKDFAEAFSGRSITLNEYIRTEAPILQQLQAKDIISTPTELATESCHGLTTPKKRGVWCPVWMGNPLLSLLDMFGKGVNLQRVPVIADGGKVVGVVSQSRVIEEVSRHLNEFGTLGDTSVTKLYEPGPVFSVKENDPITNALQIILEYGVSGVAIIDQDGKLVGSISGSDLKAACPDAISMLVKMNGSVKELKESSSDPSRPRVISCTDDDTLAGVIDKMQKYRVHRVFVVDANNHPRGVISFSDLISFLSNEFLRASH